ncbi:hypothetical protein D3C81_1529730 [compost metagenome]
MLSDTARKLLLIINHSIAHHKRHADMAELELRSGRKRVDILDGLGELAKERYIEWRVGVPPEKLKLLEGWERQEPVPTWQRRK